jgi:membrane peptidoglycan carboxypeptidase
VTPGEFHEEDPPRRPVRSLIGLILGTATIGVLVAGLLVPVVLSTGVAAGHAADRFLKAGCDVHESRPPQRSTLLARDGKTVIAQFFTQNRSPVPLSAVPRPLVRALIATEDRRFYDHHGVDLRGLLRAAVHDASGGATQGGSTLTMQYVKQVRYYQATTDAQRNAAIAPTLDRKLQNAKCALDLERHFTKDQILEKYLNIAFFGENSYGLETAS